LFPQAGLARAGAGAGARFCVTSRHAAPARDSRPEASVVTAVGTARAWFDSLPGPVRGAAWMTLTGALFSFNAAAVRHVAGEVNGIEVAFFRSLFGVPLMLPWLMRVGLVALTTRHAKLYVARGTVSGLNTMFWFTALAYIPVADATAISFLAPIFGSLAAIAMLGEPMRARRWVAVAVGFAGMAVILRPGFVQVNLGAVLVLLSTFGVAINSVMVKTATRTDSPDTIAFYQILIMVPVTLIPSLFVWTWPSAEGWFWLGIVGLASTLAHRSLGRAFAAADVTAVQPFDFMRMPFAVAFGFLMFDELPDVWTWAGGATIFASSAYVAHREAQLARRRRVAAAESVEVRA
jgi:drug/metabolite transporter (DMT)-like permease